MLGKVIAVQNGLDGIADKLKKRGYHVTDFNGTKEPIDAMVYSEQVGYSNPPEVTNSRMLMNNQYVVMLNADELEEDEIVNRIDAID